MISKVIKFARLVRSREPVDKIYLRERIMRVPVVGSSLRLWRSVAQRTSESYIKMQKRSYELYAAADKVTPGNIGGDCVVGSWKAHDEWADYGDYLMKYVPRDGSWVALEYGCGPGRNLRRWSASFARIDGVDISRKNLDNALIFIRDAVPESKWPRLYVTEGMNCGGAALNHYDFAFSTICIQHICVHQVRYQILSSLFACLKPGGRLSIQMGRRAFTEHCGYFENHVQAVATNRGCDVAISAPGELEGDLRKIGFRQFEYWIRSVGPGDIHPNWIFFTAVKPA